MNKKYLNYLLTLNSLGRKLEILQLNNNLPAFFRVKRSFIGYKKIKTGQYGEVVAELLLLPETVIQIPCTTVPLTDKWNYWDCAKCRASSVFYPEKDSLKRKQWIGWSSYDEGFKYTPGTMIFPRQRYCYQPRICAAGIHFFLTEEEARDYLI